MKQLKDKLRWLTHITPDYAIDCHGSVIVEDRELAADSEFVAALEQLILESYARRKRRDADA